MRDNFSIHAPHDTDWRRPVSTNAAWLLALICWSLLSGVAGWILHGVLR